MRNPASDAKYLGKPKAIAKYLNKALSANDARLITKAIGEMARAQGMTRFSHKAGMRRDTLYRSLSGNKNPPFEFVLKVLAGLDMQLIVKPLPRSNQAR